MSKKVLCLLLSCLLVLVALVACQEPNEGEKQTGSSLPATSPDTDAPDEGRSGTKDNLPETMDFGGSDVVFHVRGDDDAVIEIFVEEDNTQNRVNQAVYNRNEAVNNRLKVNVKVHVANGWATYGDSMNELIGSINAGDASFDIISAWSHMCTSPIAYGCYMDLSNVDYLDLAQPWWNQQINETCNINDRQYLAAGEISTSYTNCSYVYVFNKTVLEDFKNVITDNFYDVVLKDNWTIEYVDNIITNMNQDLNGDGVDEADRFGLVTETVQAADAYLQAFGVDLLGRDDTGYYFDTNMEKLVGTVERVYALLYKTEGAYVNNAANSSFSPIRAFEDDRSLFYVTYLWDVEHNMADMNSLYGILPFPKYDAEQKDYYTPMSNGLSVMSIPIDVKNVNMSAAVLEAMAAESYRKVTEEYYEVVLKGRYTQDEESKEMLDIINRNRRVTFEVLYNNYLWTPLFVMRSMINNQTKDVVSWWDENYPLFESKLNDLMDELHSITVN